MSLRILFAGTPDFAAVSLAALIEKDHQIIGVYTQPDRPAGRGRKLTPSPVKQLAVEHGIPVFQPLNFRTEEAVEELKAQQADLMIVVAYGLILPLNVLEAPRLGCINVHGSLLPRWRGAAPIHRAVLAGDAETGITIMKMDVGLDTGDMILKASCPISATANSGQLHDQLAELGAETLCTALEDIDNLLANAEQQDDALANYAHKLEKAEGEVDWNSSSAEVDRKIRGLSPWPVAFTYLDGKPLRLWNCEIESQSESSSAEPGTLLECANDAVRVATLDGVLRITQLQLSGGKVLDAKSLLNARRDQFAAGTQLGQRDE